MEISNIVIAGAGGQAEKIKDLFARAGVKATVSDFNFSGADLVIEALSAGRSSRERVLGMAERQAREGAVLATTASSGITELAACLKKPESFAGLNFTFNPLQDRCLVQMVKGLETSAGTVETCRDLLEKAGLTFIEAEDSPGLVLDRVIATVINEAATMYATKITGVEDIDRVMKLCLNWPVGPFELADTIGLDNVLATLDTMSAQIGPQYSPCRLLRGMVASGRLGKKTGRGFYIYS